MQESTQQFWLLIEGLQVFWLFSSAFRIRILSFFNWLFITPCAYTKEARIWILKQMVFHSRPGKIQTLAIKQMGRRETTFSIWAHSRSSAVKQIFCSVWNWFGMKQRRKKHILHKLMVTTSWIRQILTILEANDNVWNYFLSLPNLIQCSALGGRVTRWLLSNLF